MPIDNKYDVVDQGLVVTITKEAYEELKENTQMLAELQADDSVIISKKEYDQLKRADAELSALHAGGVDNWTWYSESLIDAGFYDDE